MSPMRRMAAWFYACLLLPALATAAVPDFSPALPPPALDLRIATYNSSLYDEREGGLIARLEAGDAKARKIAAVIQHQRPDILLLNEFDFDPQGRAAETFQRRYLEVGQSGEQPIRYDYRYLAPVNTGVPSGMDLDRDGKVGGEGRSAGNDAFGYGLHPGQYGLLVLSRYPIDAERARTFQNFLWKDLPGAALPRDPATGASWYPQDVIAGFRLSSKSHWDLPIDTPRGRIHFLVAHPTPPVFDGPEDRNGARNHDEIRFWNEYVTPGAKPWLCDDRGRCGGLATDALFVIAGDLNNDPADGDGRHDAIVGLIENPRVLRMPTPRSEGAELAARTVGGGNLAQRGSPAQDTGDFGPRVGNLRLDYVLPSVGLPVKASGVFWPKPGEAGADWIDASDHHMVWIDIASPD
ncbi:endonuclease/exonuclease/phosphatase family protein [Arenimonas sp.]|uniref:endonuclease/exonuclease/phosphatase family protein n=1 Tax=Arenimonas sp. TaxID=1872635 RepID=UPI0039E3FFBD